MTSLEKENKELQARLDLAMKECERMIRDEQAYKLVGLQAKQVYEKLWNEHQALKKTLRLLGRE